MRNFLKLFFRKVSLIAAVVVILFVFGEKKTASADTCSSTYGASYQCFNASAITASGLASCKSDITCPTAGAKCCPASAVSFSGGGSTSGAPCAAGFACKDPSVVAPENLGQCTSSCVSQTTANGRCCPLVNSNIGSIGQIVDNKIPGTTEAGGIIQCGRGGQDMCTLCDIIKGMNTIIKYLMKIAIGVALLAMAIGGVMYIISAGDSGLIDTAKSTLKNAAIGFVIIFAGYLIINTTINYIGSKKNAAGEATFGMNITSWGNFDCNPSNR